MKRLKDQTANFLHYMMILLPVLYGREGLALDVFDAQFVPENADLITVDLTESQSSNSFLPPALDATFMSRGKQMRLALKHYPEKQRPFANISANTKSKYHIGDGIPVYTRMWQDTKSNRSRDGSTPSVVILDAFPRLFVHTCRTYRDYKNRAAVVGIQDPRYNSLKFFGTFSMDGVQYFLQPFASHNNSRPHGAALNESTAYKRYHILEEVPSLDYSADGGQVLKVERPFARSQAGENLGRRPDLDRRGVPGDLGSGRETKTGENVQTSGPTSAPGQQPQPRWETGAREASGSAPDLGPSTGDNADGSEYKEGRRKRRNRKKQERLLSLLNSNNNKEDSAGKPARNRRLKARNLSRTKRATAANQVTVEVFIVCDFLCYQRFQSLYNVSDPVMLKNMIAEYFAFVREFYQTAYGAVGETYPDLQLSIEIRVVGLYIATDASDKIIGDYVIGNANDVDSRPTAFEFALWVQDSLRVSLKADHYALVTGYDLSGDSPSILGIVTNIPSVCQIDRISLNELRLPATALVMAHELGHSLGAQHDGLTNGFCQDEQQFIMAAFLGGPVPPANIGNPSRFSECSALFFADVLPSKACLKRDDFQGSPLPETATPVGQVFPLDQQCATFINGSQACREQITTAVQGSWMGICSNNLCLLPGSPGLCFSMSPLQFTSCGNQHWCVDGSCVNTLEAPEKPVDCPAGDNATVSCEVSLCSRTYDDVTRFINCCDTCRPLKTERFIIVSDQ